MWIQSVFNAISEVESRYPGLVHEVAAYDSTTEWSKEQWDNYGKVASAIVEPFAYPDGKSDDEQFYYERTERDGFKFVKANIDGIDNLDSWRKICDLIEEMGY